MAHMSTFNLVWESPNGSPNPSMDDVAGFITCLSSPSGPGPVQHEEDLKRTKRMLEGGEDANWEDALEHMTMLSLAWPDVLFTLDGRDQDDNQWKTFYFAGRSETIEAMVVFPDFDPQSLRMGSVPRSSSMEDQVEQLKSDVTQAGHERQAKSDTAISLFRSLYGHAPDHLKLLYTGQGHITIIAGKQPRPNAAVIIDPHRGAKIITWLHDRHPTTRQTPAHLIPSDTELLSALKVIRTEGGKEKQQTTV